MKEAFYRALRTTLQAFVASAVVVNIAYIKSLADIKLVGTAWAFAAVNAIVVGVVSFLHNLAEEETPLPTLLK
jgi:hypothetical protein